MAPRSGSPSRRCACSLRPEGGDLVFLRSRRAPYHLERGTHRVLRMRRIRDRVAKADLVALAQDLVDGAGLRSVDTGTLQGCAELTGRVAGIDAEALDGVAAEARGEQRVVLGRLALLRQTLLRERVELAERALHRREALLRRDLHASPQQHPEDDAGERGERGDGRDAECDARELRGERLGQVELWLERLHVRGVLAV